MGVSSQIGNPDDPKAILNYIFQEVVKYKSSSLSWSADSLPDVRSNVAYAAGLPVSGHVGAMDKRSDANSGQGGSPRPANSAMADSDIGGGNNMEGSDNSYAELQKLHWESYIDVFNFCNYFISVYL